jgi:hypothetical protein
MVSSPEAQFALARQMRTADGAPLGDVFSFVSGLYFRGKLAYARRFAAPPDPAEPITAGGVLVITPNAGLRAADTPVTLESFRSFASASIDLANPGYRGPIERAAHGLREAIGDACEVVLLGSIASGKYVEVLLPIFGDALVFPPAFVGRGDMSRGGLMLRCVTAGVELEYAPIAGAVRHGQRPPRLVPVTGPAKHTRSEGGTHDTATTKHIRIEDGRNDTGPPGRTKGTKRTRATDTGEPDGPGASTPSKTARAGRA